MQLSVIERFELAANEHLAVGIGHPDRHPDGPSGEGVVSGDHQRPDAGLPAGGHGGGHFRSRRVELGHQAQQHLSLETLAWAWVMGSASKGQHPEPGGGQLQRLLQPPLPLLRAHRHHASAIHPAIAQAQDHFRSPFADQQAR